MCVSCHLEQRKTRGKEINTRHYAIQSWKALSILHINTHKVNLEAIPLCTKALTTYGLHNTNMRHPQLRQHRSLPSILISVFWSVLSPFLRDVLASSWIFPMKNARKFTHIKSFLRQTANGHKDFFCSDKNCS